MRPTQYSFANEAGVMLSAHMEWPANQQPHTYVLFAHCFTCGKNLNGMRNISKALAGRGFAVFTFDFTGLGKSDGNFADTTFSANVNDLIAAADFLKKDFTAPALLLGHSLGGAAIIQAATRIESVKAVAAIGSPADVTHILHIFADALPELKATGIASVNIGGRPFMIKKAYPINLFVLARILFPYAAKGKVVDLKMFYFNNYRKIFLIFIISAGLSISYNLAILNMGFETQILQVLLATIIIALKKFEQEWVHKGLSVIVFGIFVVSVIIEWDVWLIE